LHGHIGPRISRKINRARLSATGTITGGTIQSFQFRRGNSAWGWSGGAGGCLRYAVMFTFEKGKRDIAAMGGAWFAAGSPDLSQEILSRPARHAASRAPIQKHHINA
jgi:hypothetical protein